MIFQIINVISNELNVLFSNHVLCYMLLIFFIIATYTDIKSFKIYNKFNIVFFITRIIIIFVPVHGVQLTLNHLMGALIGFLTLTIPAMALMHKMGGDIKFITILGLYLGASLTVVLLLISCITMLIFSFTKKMITKEKIKKVLVPFAPFFMISFVIMFIISTFI